MEFAINIFFTIITTIALVAAFISNIPDCGCCGGFGQEHGCPVCSKELANK